MERKIEWDEVRIGLVVGVRRSQDALSKCSRLQDGAVGTCPQPNSRRGHAQHLGSPRPGAGSQAIGPEPRNRRPRSWPRAHTPFAGAGDRRALNAQATHAAGGPTGGQADTRRWQQLHDLRAEAAAFGAGLPSCSQPRSHRSQGPMGGADRRAAGAGLRDAPPFCRRGPSPPLGDRQRRGPASHAGPPVSALPGLGLTV